MSNFTWTSGTLGEFDDDGCWGANCSGCCSRLGIEKGRAVDSRAKLRITAATRWTIPSILKTGTKRL